MRRLLLLLLLGLSLLFAAPLAAAASPLAALPGFSQVFAGSPPAELGIRDGELTPCPESPNCVVSRTDADAAHQIAPLSYAGDRQAARTTVLRILQSLPRATIVEQTDDYIRIEFASRLMGFVDDSEFYFPAEQSAIEVRSAARLGESDLGVNRRRLEQIRLALQELGV